MNTIKKTPNSNQRQRQQAQNNQTACMRVYNGIGVTILAVVVSLISVFFNG